MHLRSLYTTTYKTLHVLEPSFKYSTINFYDKRQKFLSGQASDSRCVIVCRGWFMKRDTENATAAVSSRFAKVNLFLKYMF